MLVDKVFRSSHLKADLVEKTLKAVDFCGCCLTVEIMMENINFTEVLRSSDEAHCCNITFILAKSQHYLNLNMGQSHLNLDFRHRTENWGGDN